MGEFIQWTAHYGPLYIFCSGSQDDEGEAIGNEERFDGNHDEGKKRETMKNKSSPLFLDGLYL